MKQIKLLFILCAYATIANAATVYYVSSTGNNTTGDSWATAFTSPAAAIASTTPQAGDEFWVKQGTYASATTLNWETGQNFYGGFIGTETQRSERSTDASLTILEGNNTNRVLNAPAMASATTWDGFTIQKGLTTGGGAGVFMQKNAILQNCVVKDNVTTDFGGGGIFIQGGATDTDSIKVLNCVIKNNINTKSGAAKRGGGGIYVKAGSYKAVIRGCTIENNTVDGLANSGSDVDGGGVYLCDGILEGSIIRNNIATNKNASTQALSLNGKCQGGGIFIMPQTTSNPITVRNCTITGNTANTSQGGGIAIDPLWSTAVIAANVNVSNSIITNNSAYKAGGGIVTDGQAITSSSSYTFTNCVIANNESSNVAAGGGGAFVNNATDYAGAVSFNNCTVVNNKMLTTNYGGAGIFYNNIKADITNCAFWGNGSVGTLAPYNVRVKNTLTTNKLINCAFDNRFIETEVSPVATPADLTGKVIVDIANSGSTGGTLYANFVSPTNFVGKVVSGADQTSLNAANWALLSTSALIDAGVTVSAITTDIAGVARPQGATSKYDIGAYEYSSGISTATIQNTSKIRIFAANGQLVIDNHSSAIQIVAIYSLTGTQLNGFNAKEGRSAVTLPKGQLYLVKVGEQTQKVLLY